MSSSSSSPGAWIGVDLDGTLAFYDQWRGINHIGAPVPLMVERVKAWLAAGRNVKIFTARVAGHGKVGGPQDVLTPIRQWCLEHLGVVLEVTNVKDFGMVELWDDRAVQVELNTGRPAVSRRVSGLPAESLVQRLAELAHRPHYNCEEDTFYGCPLSRDGCSDQRQPAGVCNCGADAHNAEVQKIVLDLRALLGIS